MNWFGHGEGSWAVSMFGYLVLYWGGMAAVLYVGLRAVLQRMPQLRPVDRRAPR